MNFGYTIPEYVLAPFVKLRTSLSKEIIVLFFVRSVTDYNSDSVFVCHIQFFDYISSINPDHILSMHCEWRYGFSEVRERAPLPMIAVKI